MRNCKELDMFVVLDELHMNLGPMTCWLLHLFLAYHALKMRMQKYLDYIKARPGKIVMLQKYLRVVQEKRQSNDGLIY